MEVAKLDVGINWDCLENLEVLVDLEGEVASFINEHNIKSVSHIFLAPHSEMVKLIENLCDIVGYNKEG